MSRASGRSSSRPTYRDGRPAVDAAAAKINLRKLRTERRDEAGQGWPEVKWGPPGEGRTDAAPTPTACSDLDPEHANFITRNEVVMVSAILAALLLFQAPDPAWHPSRNYPGWEGYGIPSGDYLDPERWRRTAEPSTELLPDGTVIVEMTAAPTDDPYGFTAWLNATRATYGLPAVGHDPNLSSWAAVNNSHQLARGMGHHVMGPARRQNAAMMSYPALRDAWLASPGHRSALLDPTIRWIGIAGSGAYWTFNAN